MPTKEAGLVSNSFEVAFHRRVVDFGNIIQRGPCLLGPRPIKNFLKSDRFPFRQDCSPLLVTTILR